MKKGWQTIKLCEVCAVDKQQGTHKGLPYVGMENIERDTGRFIGSVPTEVRSTTFKFNTAHLLYGRLRPYLNKVMLPDFAGHCSTEIIPLKPGPELLRPFLRYWFLHDTVSGQINATCTGARMPRANMNAVLDLKFPLAPLTEQQQIVGILDKAFAGIAIAKANAEKNLQNARALFESNLHSVFGKRNQGWLEKPFEDCIVDVKYTAKIQRKEFLEEGEFPIVSQEADFINGFWDNAADVFKANRPVVVFGDHTKVLKYIDFNFVLGADGVKILLAQDFLAPKYFFYSLRCARLESLGYSRHYRLLKEFQISYPDIDKQVEIAKKLDNLAAETQRLESIYRRKLAAFEELKKSLLHQAFNGDL